MKPNWDKLMKNWNQGDNLKTSLIADVDCTAAGKGVCDTVGVRGYPTIKWGDPASLEDYEGGRDYEALHKFAEENLKPMCSPANIDLCDEAKKKEIADLQALPSAELDAKIAEKKATLKEAEELFESEVKKLQDHYTQLQKDKDDAIAEVKASGLALMQAVKARPKKVVDEL